MHGGKEGRQTLLRRTGHIRERSPGSFELRRELGTDPASGKRRTMTVTVRGSRKDAKGELRRLLRARACPSEPDQGARMVGLVA